MNKYREWRCRCHVWWKTVPEVGARNWKSPFADSGEVEWRYSKLVGGNRPESLPGWHISDTSEVWCSKLGKSLAVAWSGLLYKSWLHTFIHLKPSERLWTVFHIAESPTVVHCTAAEQSSSLQGSVHLL